MNYSYHRFPGKRSLRYNKVRRVCVGGAGEAEYTGWLVSSL